MKRARLTTVHGEKARHDGGCVTVHCVESWSSSTDDVVDGRIFSAL